MQELQRTVLDWTIRRGFSGAKATKVFVYSIDGTRIATSNFSYLVSLKQPTIAHIANHCVLRLCKIWRHSAE
jgi:hypothetical protein